MKQLSNSQKTAEYFSKQLGEITVWDESVSVSESKGKEEKGKSESKSTNKFSRPLMTPDEIRRLGDDECIIIEKGVKPILAQKYYYFKEPGGRVLLNYTANHNEYKVNRGPWREFDGNMRKNPEDINRELVQQFGGNEKELLGIKSDKNTKGTSKDVRNLGIEDLNNDIYSFSEDAFKEEPRKKEEKKKIIKNLEVNLEKELEKKFDELFGEIEESERTKGK